MPSSVLNENQFLMVLAPGIKYLTKGKGEQEKTMFIAKGGAFHEKFVAVYGVVSWKKFDFSVSVRLYKVKCLPCEKRSLLKPRNVL